MNTAPYWDKVYRAEVAVGYQRVDAIRLAELLRWVGVREAEVQRPAVVLDVGCGAGDALVGLVRNNPGRRVVGVDISPFAVECVRGNGLEAHAAAADAKLGERWPRRFDIVWSGETLEHLDDPLGAVESFGKLINPGGLLVLSAPYRMGNPSEEHLWEFGLADVVAWAALVGGELLYFDTGLLPGWLSMFVVIRVPAS